MLDQSVFKNMHFLTPSNGCRSYQIFHDPSTVLWFCLNSMWSVWFSLKLDHEFFSFSKRRILLSARTFWKLCRTLKNSPDRTYYEDLTKPSPSFSSKCPNYRFSITSSIIHTRWRSLQRFWTNIFSIDFGKCWTFWFFHFLALRQIKLL